MSTDTATRPAAEVASDVELGTVDIVVPVFNEERALASSVRTLARHVRGMPFPARIVIADNASTDATWNIAQSLAAEDEVVSAVRLDRKGRGLALRQVWAASDATVVAYMDVDLSTGLDALMPLLAPLLSGHSDVAIGTRLGRGSHVVRGPKREFISRTYNAMLRATLAVRFSDAQCGFKAVRTDRVRELLPLVKDDKWFFDTELLVLAERAGLRIHEVPVDWVDDPDSRVHIASTAWEDIRGMARVAWGLGTGAIDLNGIEPRRTPGPDPHTRLWGQIVRFALVGIASTLAFSVLYLLFRMWLPAQAASVTALLLATIANTAVNRRFTFGVVGRRRLVTHQFQGLLLLGMALALTSASLWVLHSAWPAVGAGAEVIVLTCANLVATVLRFVLFRGWVFRSTRSS